MKLVDNTKQRWRERQHLEVDLFKRAKANMKHTKCFKIIFSTTLSQNL